MFGITDFGTFCGAILVFLALPGPGTLALLTATSKGGLRAGAAATLGLILGDQVLLWLAVAGVATLLATYPVAFHGFKYLGAAYLAWIGLKLIWAGPGAAPPILIEPHRCLRQAFLVTLINPKAIVFYMAFFPIFLHPNDHPSVLSFATLALAVALITATYCLTLCVCARAITSRFSAHRGLAQLLQRLAGTGLIGFGIRLGTQ